MSDEITIETELFEHRETQPHFINPCCFGEDFAGWLREKLASLGASGFEFSEPIQEDYGWGFWVKHGKESFWIALGFVGEGPTEGPAEWVVSVNADAGPNLFKRLFHKPDPRPFHALRDAIWHALQSTEGIKILAPEGAGA
jgi:hypothetical protein